MRLRIGAMVLGFIGAISAYFTGGSFFGGSFLGQFGVFFGDAEIRVALVIFLIVLILGLIGAAITLAKPTVAGILMLISGLTVLIGLIIGMIETLGEEAVGPQVILFAPGSIPLIIAGVLALIARKEED